MPSVLHAYGTAFQTSDYTAGPYSVTIPANTASASFTIQTTVDTAGEIDRDHGI